MILLLLTWQGNEIFIKCPNLIILFSSGPVMALALAREDAVQGWREMLGPTELEVARTEHPDRSQ